MLGVARVVVGVVLAVPVLAILIFITGEATCRGPDDVPFGKLGHRVHVEQQQQPVERSVHPQVALTSPPANATQPEAHKCDYQMEADAAREAWTQACLAKYEGRFGYDYERGQCSLVPADYYGCPVWNHLPETASVPTISSQLTPWHFATLSN